MTNYFINMLPLQISQEIASLVERLAHECSSATRDCLIEQSSDSATWTADKVIRIRAVQARLDLLIELVKEQHAVARKIKFSTAGGS